MTTVFGHFETVEQLLQQTTMGDDFGVGGELASETALNSTLTPSTPLLSPAHPPFTRPE